MSQRFKTGWCVPCNQERLVTFARVYEGGRWRRKPCCQACGERVAPQESKYRNQPTRTAEGKLRQSRKEARREDRLMLEQKAGAICEVRSQVRYPLEVYSTPAVQALLDLLEAPEEDWTSALRLAREVRRAKHRICAYVADAVYVDAQGNEVVEDTKPSSGFRTAVYTLKRKLFLACYGKEIVET